MGADVTAREMALRRKAHLENELNKINTFIAVHDELTAATHSGANETVPAEKTNRSAETPASAELRPTPAESRSRTPAVPKQIVTDAIFEVLEDAGRPMTSTELLGALHSRGVSVGGRAELKNLTTRLWREKEDFPKVGNAYTIASKAVIQEPRSEADDQRSLAADIDPLSLD